MCAPVKQETVATIKPAIRNGWGEFLGRGSGDVLRRDNTRASTVMLTPPTAMRKLAYCLDSIR
jgi:hypothetical protein